MEENLFRLIETTGPMAVNQIHKKTSIYFQLMVVKTKKIRISEAVNPYQLLSID